MPDLMIETRLFPGSADVELVEWLRQRLAQRGYDCDAPKEDDGFWGFWVKQQAVPIWVLVASVSDEGPTFEWGVSVDPKVSLLNPKLWFKKDEGKQMARQIMAVIKGACEADPDIEVVAESDDDEKRGGPLTLVVGPNRFPE